MSELKSQTMTAAIAAAIMDDITVLVERLESVQSSLSVVDKNIQLNAEKNIKNLRSITDELSKKNGDIYSSLNHLLSENRTVRNEIKLIFEIEKRKKESRKKLFRIFLFGLMISIIVIMACYFVF